MNERDEQQADNGVNGCSDVITLLSNTSSHMHQLLNLQRNPQVVCVIFSFYIIFKWNC